jgi:serine/threonine-protein kinase OSR1/STK39
MADPTDWPTDPSLYELIGKIGQGAFASVWKADTKSDGDKDKQRECAIKVLNLDHVDSNLSEIRLEVQAMRLSSHPNVLQCHAAFVKATDLWLVTQLMRKGSSLHCLDGARRKYREMGQPAACKMEDHILYILHETLLGLQYIHDNGQIHRDIKAGNILIDSDGHVRIADFGVSGWLVNAGTQQEKAKTFVGTPCWMAPEVMEQIHGYDYKADIWSLGITALELAKGYAPYARYPPMKVLILTIQEDPPSLDTYDEEDGMDDETDQVEEDFTKNFRQLLEKCLQKNPAKRPKTQELLSSKHLDGLQDEATRQARRKALVEQVCELVDDVGSSKSMSRQIANSQSGSMPGNTPISIVMSAAENNRPAGTTWVFADGSQVLASSTSNNATVDDVMAELDMFGQQTGGENYKGAAAGSAAAAPKSATASSNTSGSGNKNEEPDDLSAFMDEFEMNTQGENFQRGS